MICERLKKLRIDSGLKQGEIAKKLGISQRVLSALERGETQPTIKQIEAICVFFGVSSDYLIRGIDITLTDRELEIIKVLRNDNKLLKNLMKIADSKKEIDKLAA